MTARDTTNPLWIRTYANGLLKSELFLTALGGMAVAVGGVVRPIPFATWANSVPVTLTNQTNAGAAPINFPTGRFTSTPFVFMQVIGSQSYVPYIAALSLTSVQAAIRHVDNVATSGTFTVYIFAVQMSPTGPAG